MKNVKNLLMAAIDLTKESTNQSSYQKLLEMLCNIFEGDSACLFKMDDSNLNRLTVKSAYGLAPEIMFRKFYIDEEPRLEAILKNKGPCIFSKDSPLKDPFDGLLSRDSRAGLSIHSCFGTPIYHEKKVIALLCVDAHDPNKFEKIKNNELKLFVSLAEMAIVNAHLFEKLKAYQRKIAEEQKSFISYTNTESLPPILGVSNHIKHIQKEIDSIAKFNIPVLIQGETGTGKEVIARNIHHQYLGPDAPLIYVNCAALPESIAESELFGHEKGSFTDAYREKKGKFELAKDGTIFLDEIGELSTNLQSKLLRVLQEGEIQKIGSDKLIKINARIIAATNRELLKRVEEGKFRNDLYHRLNVYPINLYPLRERKEDIPIYIYYFSDILQKQYKIAPVRYDKDAIEIFKSYKWPGNVREIKNVLSRIFLTSIKDSKEMTSTNQILFDKEAIIPHFPNLKIVNQKTPTENLSLKELTTNYQKEIIENALDRHNNNWSQAAKSLKMDRSNLYNLAKKIGVYTQKISHEK